ncbi:type II toxin-antitoxin system RelB family antitoxin [Halotalea alkalilenta]|nr:DUF6290 family protein [Halotalea alkalilenta]
MHVFIDFEHDMATSIRLPIETEQRLNHLAEATGRSKAFYLRKLIEDNLDELEDVYLAERTLERIRQGEEETLSHEAFWHEVEG